MHDVCSIQSSVVQDLGGVTYYSSEPIRALSIGPCNREPFWPIYGTVRTAQVAFTFSLAEDVSLGEAYCLLGSIRYVSSILLLIFWYLIRIVDIISFRSYVKFLPEADDGLADKPHLKSHASRDVTQNGSHWRLGLNSDVFFVQNHWIQSIFG